ncbi:hypothetical protein B0I37DRAFT_437937 [Chaetomium sp. MPI-CAGE-AT-0009]|nr:hypothetical protein B0I37DRAFT_437937 [Chaetomium sp. MPI-CAGE-AT-0009]
MDHAENTEVVERKVGHWTFRRSLVPLATRLEGQELRASWEHGGYFFGVWEIKVLVEVPKSECRICHWEKGGYSEQQGDFSFFRWRWGAPLVYVVGKPCEGSWEERTAPERDTHDILTLRKLTTFQVPRVIYHTERAGWECTIIDQVQGHSLQEVIAGVVGGGSGACPWVQDSTHPVHVAEVTRICTRVADQVVDAVVEMSKWTGRKVCGLGGKLSPDIHFAKAGQFTDMGSPKALATDEVAQVCKDAGMDPSDTVLGPGNLSPLNIILDEGGNFVGFKSLSWAGYAPRNWVQLGTIDPNDRLAARINVYANCDIGGLTVPEKGSNSVRLLWQNILSEKLASKGFPKLDAHRLPWLAFPAAD